MLAVEREIQVLFMDRSGTPVARIWSPRYGSISTIRKGQLNFTFTRDALEWIKGVIAQKMENQQALMLLLQTDDPDDPRGVNTPDDVPICEAILKKRQA